MTTQKVFRKACCINIFLKNYFRNNFTHLKKKIGYLSGEPYKLPLQNLKMILKAQNRQLRFKLYPKKIISSFVLKSCQICRKKKRKKKKGRSLCLLTLKHNTVGTWEQKKLHLLAPKVIFTINAYLANLVTDRGKKKILKKGQLNYLFACLTIKRKKNRCQCSVKSCEWSLTFFFFFFFSLFLPLLFKRTCCK